MFYNYLKIALRLISRNKLISAINILGLALALTGSLMIGIFIQDELSYDHYHKNSNHIYRVTRNFLSPDGSVSLHLGLIASPLVHYSRTTFRILGSPDVSDTVTTR